MRTKIIAGNLVAVLVVGLVSYFVISSQMRATLVAEVDGRIASDHEMVGSAWTLSSLQLVTRVSEQAEQRSVADVFAATSQVEQRRRANVQSDRIGEWLSRQGAAGRPELVAITDDRGRVVARDHDPNRMQDFDLRAQIPTLARTLETGEPVQDVWRYTEGQPLLLQVAAAPIRAPGGGLIGAVVVGYDMSNGMAQRLGAPLERDVVFLANGAVHSSSLDGSLADGLRVALVEQQRQHTEAALAASADEPALSPPFLAAIGDVEYVGVVGRLPASPSTAVAYAVLANRSAQTEKASPVAMLLFMTLFGVAVVLGYGLFIGSSFLRPIAQLEEQILAVINGRTDVRLDIESTELGGLAYRINQLLNVFTGTPEEDSEGRVSAPPEAAWGDEAGSGESRAAPSAPGASAAGEDEASPEEVEKLAAEPEDAYYARIYEEYVDAKKGVGEDVSNVPQDRFVQRLQANEKQLVKKHGCRMVRFQVQTRGTQVNLRPVIIR
ncbi:MAG: PDC sensor domain-containing protein [Sandaracinaceae bacterium]|nr:PDC sensor domain-containing protein [Sandaracinaceae bacterium]